MSEYRKPAFPTNYNSGQDTEDGMELRDWFAGTIGHPDIEGVSQCDDQDLLERYGTEEEKEEGFIFAVPGYPIKFKSILLRQRLEAAARAELRYIEADAMLKEREAPDA